MLHEKIRNVSAQLGELAGRLSHDDYRVVRLARMNLLDLADYVGELEQKLCPAEDAAEEA